MLPRLYSPCKSQQAALQTEIKLTSFDINYYLESKREHYLEITNKEVHEIFTNFQNLYLENQPCK